MTTFLDSAEHFLSTTDNADVRRAAWARFVSTGLPTTADEVWRYAPLELLNLDAYQVPSSPGEAVVTPVAAALAAQAAVVVHIVDGFLVDVVGEVTGVTIEATALVADDRYPTDAFAHLTQSCAPRVVDVAVAPGTTLNGPLVVVSSVTASSAFPYLRYHVGRSASASVVEYWSGGDHALVAPISEYDVADNGSLDITVYQRLAATAWHVARTQGTLARDARLRHSVISVGGRYNRSRNDCDLVAPGAHNELHTTFLGSASQVHDFRTRQFHLAGRTTSTLLSKGAVADSSRSIYTGVIEIEKGAKRTDARQTNHNLLLSPHAHADSVPNLDIRENDVMCAHASSVGPLDELQRWYLESRGVPRGVAERLMIQGFFYEMLATLAPAVSRVIEDDVVGVLTSLAVVSK